MGKIRLLVADEETLFRECICAVLRTCPDFEVIAETASSEEMITMVRQHAPDVVVMNLAMPIVNTYNAARLLRLEAGAVKLLLVTQNEEREWVIDGLKIEANGYVSKGASTEELFLAVRTVYRGGYFLQASIARTIVEDYARIGRSSGTSLERLEREQLLLQVLSQERAKEDITRLLHIESGSVSSNRARIGRKLGAHREQSLPKYVISPTNSTMTETAEHD